MDAFPSDDSSPTLISPQFRSNQMAFFYCCLEETARLVFGGRGVIRVAAAAEPLAELAAVDFVAADSRAAAARAEE